MVFISGFLIGLAYVAPIGMQNLFVINSSLTQTRLRAYLTALIIIFFDVTLALACFFGAGAIIQQAEIIRLLVLLIGSIVIVFIGISIIKSKSEVDSSINMDMPWTKLIGAACVVTWFNPQAVIDGSLLLGASSGVGPMFVLGVIVASSVWFLALTTIVTLFSNFITNKVLKVINIVCGIVIILYGFKLFYDFIQLAQEMFF